MTDPFDPPKNAADVAPAADELAELELRFDAWSLDRALGAGALMLGGFASSLLGSPPSTWMKVVVFAPAIWLALAQTSLLGSRGYTMGMRAVGLRVVTWPDGKPTPLGAARGLLTATLRSGSWIAWILFWGAQGPSSSNDFSPQPPDPHGPLYGVVASVLIAIFVVELALVAFTGRGWADRTLGTAVFGPPAEGDPSIVRVIARVLVGLMVAAFLLVLATAVL